jgi:hypothetical protein
VTHQAGQWLQYKLPHPVTFDHLDLEIAADGQHSVPTKLTISADGQQESVRLPPIPDGTVPGSVVDVPASFPALTGQNIRITVDDVRVEYTTNYYSRNPIALPLGIAEVGIPGVQAGTLPTSIPTSCRSDLLTVDGRPLWVSITGTTTAALSRQPLTVALCGPDAGGLALGPGPHTLRSTLGQVAGFDIDQLALDSAPGGGPMPLASATTLEAPPVTASPAVKVDSQTATTTHLTVSGLTPAAEQSGVDLVLGQSINPGWTATVAGAGSLGKPELIDGYANAWRLDRADLARTGPDGTVSVVLRWQPQGRVDLALIVSALAILLCLALVVGPSVRSRRDRRRARRDVGTSLPDDRSTGWREVSADTRPDPPVLIRPFGADAPAAPLPVALGTGAVTGVVAALIAMPAAGVAVAVASTVVLLVPRLRLALGLIAVAGIAAAGIYTVVHQATAVVPPGGSWTLSFDVANRLAWTGVVFLGADAAVEAVLSRRGARSDRAGSAGGRPSASVPEGAPATDPAID